MFNSNKVKTSFIQYTECKVCRIHHNISIKHIYSAHHQLNLKKVLKKSLEKVSLAKNTMKAPEVHCSNWENDQNFWCYFCTKEIGKHCPYNSVVVAGLGLIYHLACPEHYECVKKFLKENRVKNAKPEKYIIKKSDLLSFLEILPAEEGKFLQKINEICTKRSANIQVLEKQRSDLVLQTIHETTLAQQSTLAINNNVPQGISSQKDKNPLSVAKVSSERKVERKIPPWLLPAHITSYSMLPSSDILEEPSCSKKVPIGPTMDDYLDHVKQQEKKKLNPNRVGANFKHGMETSASWLPTFKRIWSKNHKPPKSWDKWQKRRKNP